jgi:hypothetical protein
MLVNGLKEVLIENEIFSLKVINCSTNSQHIGVIHGHFQAYFSTCDMNVAMPTELIIIA